MSFTSSVVDTLQAFPITAVGALGFYLFVASWVLPSVRAFWSRTIALPQPKRGAIGMADAMRGLAALWVAVFHISQWVPALSTVGAENTFIGAGAKAVPVFVVLSGFLVYRGLNDLSPSGIRRYLASRFMRIYPLYIAVMLVTVALLIGSEGSPVLAITSEDPTKLLSYILAQIFMFKAAGYPVSPVPQFWSIYSEVIFYLFLPVFSLATEGLEGKSTRVKICILIVALVLIYPMSQAGERTVGLWKYFIIGMLASHCYDWVASFDAMRKELVGGLVFFCGVSLLILDLHNFLPNMQHNLCAPPNPSTAGLYVVQSAHYGAGVTSACVIAWKINEEPINTIWIGLAAAAILVGGAYLRILSPVANSFLLRGLAAISYSIFGWHSVLLMELGALHNGTGGVRGLMMPWALTNELSPEIIAFGIVVPSLIFFSIISFLLIEKPALTWKARILSRSRQDIGA